MDGIAATLARVAEICARFAPTPPPAATGAGADFATHLRQALTGRPAGGAGVAGAGAQAGATPAGGDVDAWIEQAIARTGVPASWAPGLKAIAQHESSLNPSAANLGASGGDLSRTPLGLMQMLPSTFAAHAQPGRGDILNPVDNLTAAIDYIKDRYGDPASTPGLRALARGEHYRGY